MTNYPDQPLDEIHRLIKRLESVELRLLRIEEHLHLSVQAEPLIETQPVMQIKSELETDELTLQGSGTSIDRMLRKTHGVPYMADASAKKVAQTPEQVSSNEIREGGQTLEAKIGLFWLNKLGIGSLVVGIALLLLYSFQYFGPWMKIGVGYGVALILFVLASWVERRQAMTWYSNTLFGGSWALAYFTCYAMCFVPAVQVVQNPILDLCALSFIAILSTIHSIHRNSETMSILCVALALTTITLSPALEFSFGAAAILAVMISYISVHQKWYRFLLVGAIFSLISLLCIYPQILGINWFYVTQSPVKIMLALLLPSICWLSFNTAFLFLNESKEPENKLLMTAAVINVFGAIYICSVFLQPQFASTPFLLWIVLATGYAIHAKLSSSRNISALLHLDTLTALSAFNIGLVLQANQQKVDPNITIICWLIQVFLLTAVGLKSNIKSMRWFAIALGGISYLSVLIQSFYAIEPRHVASTQMMLVAAILVSALCTALYRRRENIATNEYNENAAFANIHLTAIAIFLAAIPHVFNFAEWGDNWLLAVAITLIAVGIATRHAYCRLLGNAGAVFNACLLVSTSVYPSLYWTNAHAIPRLLLLYVASLLYERSACDLRPEQARLYRNIYLSFASAQLAVLTVLNAQPDYVALLLMLEGVAFLGLGFAGRDRILRLIGNCFMGLSIIRPMMCSNEWTVFRLLPMIGVLYFTAFAHKRFSSDLDETHATHYKNSYISIATVLLTALITTKFKTTWITPSFGIEGLALLGTGFLVRDKLLRVLGLSVFGVLVFKLLFIDFAGAPTIHRIFSFIIAGVVLLLASYSYGRFTKRFTE